MARSLASAQTAPAPSRLISRIALLTSVCIWGVTFIPTKVALQEIGPFTIAFLRFVMAFAVLLPLSWGSLRALAAEIPWLRLAVMGLTGVTLYFGLQNLGLSLTAAVNAGMVLACIPVLTAVLSSALLGERLTVLRMVGLLFSIAGVAVIILAGANGAVSISWQGDLLVLISALVWAVYTVMSKKASMQIPDGLVTLGTIGFGMLFLFPLALWEGGLATLHSVHMGAWVAVSFLGIGASAAAYFLWNFALKGLDAAECGAYLNLMPVITAVAAFLFLKEAILWPQLIGGAIILLGVLLAGR